MSAMILLLDQTSLGWIILLGLGIIWYLRRWSLARNAYRSTTFELERDLARYQSGGAMMAVVVLAELVLVVVGVHQVVAPTIQDDREVQGEVISAPSQDDGVFATPTRPAPSGELAQEIYDFAGNVDLGQEQAIQVFATPTLTPTPVGTILPNAPEAIGCANDEAFLQIPANGMRVFQPIRVAGTAHIENFSLYKLEIGRPGGQFSVLDEEVIPVTELGTLSQFNPAPYEEGEYLFRLMVFDTNAELKASCQVTIYISAPVPTATPIGG